MIYISAHRVQARAGQTGYNVYAYLRPDPQGDVLDMRALQSRGEGDLFALETSVKPGGNRVVAFLDVAQTGPFEPKQLGEFIQKHVGIVDHSPFVEAGERMGLLFNADLGMSERLGAEFEHLVAQIRGFLGRLPPQQPLREKVPLTIEFERAGDSFAFVLDVPSANRVVGLKGPTWRPQPFRISSEMFHDIEQLQGGFLFQLGLILTQLDEAQLARLGGFRIVKKTRPQEKVYEWPERDD